MTLVIGVDIGTTSTKAVAYSPDGTAHARHAVRYPLDEPQVGYAEQDPDVIVAAVRSCIDHVLGAVGEPVAGLAFSSAMHSLIGLDAGGTALTPSITWADSRATAQADRVHHTPAGRVLYARSGTPLHPMSPLAKLMWFHEMRPELAARVTHWAAIKDYVLLRLCGRLVTDISVAGGSGLLDVRTLTWNPDALAIAGVGADRLPELVSPLTVLDGVDGRVAGGGALRVVVGAADGPLANLGCGAVAPGVAACSIGTSGALRVMVEQPATDPAGGVFCYPLTDDRWCVGGAINNGGIVLEWARDTLFPDGTLDDALAAAAAVPAGSEGLVMLPYLLGERAPMWTSTAHGGYVGLRIDHRRGHLVRAALEGVCHQLALVLDAVRAAGNQVHAVRATGGFARSPLWKQLLADNLGMPVDFPADYEGSCFGAALLGMQALGIIGSVDVAAALVPIAETYHPDAAAARVYAAARPAFSAAARTLSGA